MPSIKVTLPVLFICWAIGAILAGMWPLLAYPVMWAAVAAVVYAVDKLAGGANAQAIADSADTSAA